MIGFVLKICFELYNGKKVVFEGSGCQEAHVNYFKDWPMMSISPKQMSAANSTDELINMLAANVIDGDFNIFSESRIMRSHVIKGTCDAYDFINLIRKHILNINDIAKFVVELKEYNGLHFYRKYEYDCISSKYTCTKLGLPEVAEECYGEWMDQSILNFSDFDECKTIKKKDLYRDSDTDDVYFNWVGCVVME